jgi:hypothetical protein
MREFAEGVENHDVRPRFGVDCQFGPATDAQALRARECLGFPESLGFPRGDNQQRGRMRPPERGKSRQDGRLFALQRARGNEDRPVRRQAKETHDACGAAAGGGGRRLD